MAVHAFAEVHDTADRVVSFAPFVFEVRSIDCAGATEPLTGTPKRSVVRSLAPTDEAVSARSNVRTAATASSADKRVVRDGCRWRLRSRAHVGHRARPGGQTGLLPTQHRRQTTSSGPGSAFVG